MINLLYSLHQQKIVSSFHFSPSTKISSILKIESYAQFIIHFSLSLSTFSLSHTLPIFYLSPIHNQFPIKTRAVPYTKVVFGFLDKLIPRYNLGLSWEIILVIGGLAMTNYLMIIHLELNCGIKSHEPNTQHI